MVTFFLPNMRIVLTNTRYYTPEAILEGDISIEGGVITAIGVAPTAADRVVDLHGATLFPGIVDAHVHLREPGFGQKETIRSGSAAAARGGVTTLFTMPNLDPVPDTLEHLAVQEALIVSDAAVRVIPYASITMGQRGRGEIVDMAALASRVGGFSDDGRGVQSDETMAEAMRRAKSVGRPIVAHCEVDELLKGGYIHEGEYCKENNHRGICSESEWRQIERDIKLAEQIGVQYHVCHISTKESVELIRAAKSRGVKISCETAPHYLVLCDEDLKEEGRFKMNPPLRSAADRAALIEGVVDGTIDLIATDHAPHTAEEKSRGLERSAFGVVGIEFSFAACYKYLVESGLISLDRLVEMMCSAARRIFNLPEVRIEVGAVADLVAFDLSESYAIDPSEFVSMGKATPMEGLEVTGRTRLTMVGGEIVYREDKK